MSDATPDQIIADYREAYEAANGRKTYSISYASGYFRIKRGRPATITQYRSGTIIKMTEELRAKKAMKDFRI